MGAKALADAATARNGVTSVVYDATSDNFDTILAEIRSILGGNKADSIGFATRTFGDGGLTMFSPLKEGGVNNFNLGRVSAQRDFWSDVGDLVKEGGRIDLLTCDLTKTQYGRDLVGELEILTGKNVTASDDNTGNPEQGGDWILETDNIDAKAQYFDATALGNFVGVLDEGPLSFLDDSYFYSFGTGGEWQICSDFDSSCFDEDIKNIEISLTGYNFSGSMSGFAELTLDAGTLGVSVDRMDDAGEGTITYLYLTPNSGTISKADAATLLNSVYFEAPKGFDMVSVSYNIQDGDGTWFSKEITINPSNDAPVLDATQTPVFDAIAEDNTDSDGNSVADIVVDGSITDADGAAVKCIAVTAVDNTHGVWQYSTDNGSNWTNFSDTTGQLVNLATAARLLDGTLTDGSTQKIRFVPGENWSGSASISFCAWDKFSGSVGETADISTNGGNTAFSADTDTASITVNSANDAPELDVTKSHALTDIDHLTLNPAGDLVSSILTDAVTDPDNTNPGIAVTGVDDTGGTWQYSTDNGTTWMAFGNISDSSAVLLSATDKVRFLSDVAEYGTRNMTFRAWDGTTGSDGDTGVDVSTNGDATAFSSALDTASITVSSSVDSGSPVLDDFSSVDYTAGGAAIAVDSDLSISDSDSANLNAAAVYISSGFTSGDVLSFENANGITGSYDAESGVLVLSGSATVAQYEAALKSVTYFSTSSSSEAGAGTRTISFLTTDGTYDSAVKNATVNVTATSSTLTPTTPETGGDTDGGSDSSDDEAPVITDQGKADQGSDQYSPSVDDGPAENHGPESEFNGENNKFGDSAAGEFDAPGRALADLNQVLNALGGGGADVGDYGGPGGADADLSQVVRALQVAPNSLGGGFGGQADPLGINTGLQPATAESGVQQGNAPASPATQAEAGAGIENVPGEGDAEGSPQRFFAVETPKAVSSSLFADKPALQANFNRLNVEINGLRFNAQQISFSVISLEKAVNQLSQLSQLAIETSVSGDMRTTNELTDMAAELVKICQKAASNGEDVGYLMIKLDNTRQSLAH